MGFEIINDYFVRYGIVAIFVIVLLEYMNLPGFPAGIIMPLAGVMASRGEISFPVVLLVTVAAGLTGSLLLYGLGRGGGQAFLKLYGKHFPGQARKLEENLDWVRRKGCVGVFLAKLIPAVRTLVSIPAGVIGMKPLPYVISSTLGITIWNFFFVGAGYLLGEKLFVRWIGA